MRSLQVRLEFCGPLPGNRIGFIELKHHDNNERCCYRAVSYSRIVESSNVIFELRYRSDRSARKTGFSETVASLAHFASRVMPELRNVRTIASAKLSMSDETAS
jgi:hypothetical protein